MFKHLVFFSALLLTLSAKAQNSFVSASAAISILPGTFVYVDGTLVADSGVIIDNNGQIIITKDVTNNSGSAIFSPAAGEVVLSGDTQDIGGSASTVFDKLILDGTNYKTLSINGGVRDSLALNNRIFDIQAQQFQLHSGLSNSLSRGNGYISTNGGSFVRNTNKSSVYLFSVGNMQQNIYRPIEMILNDTSFNTFAVGFVANNPTTDGYSTSLLDSSLCKVNNNFYHRLHQPAGNSTADVVVYYDTLADGHFNTLASWLGAPWQNIGNNNTIAGPLTGIQTQWTAVDTVIALGASSTFLPVIEVSNTTGICSTDSIQLTVLDSANTYVWSTGATGPVIQVYASGNYTATATDVNGCTLIADTSIVRTNQPAAVADFNFTINSNAVNFTNTSQSATLYAWQVDGIDITTAQDTALSLATGPHNICLVASNNCSADTICKSVTITSVADHENFHVQLYPNPSTGVYYLQGSSTFNDVSIIVTNTVGQLVNAVVKHSDNTVVIDISSMPAGIYHLKIVSGHNSSTRVLVKH